jgi:hypothetical protein
MIKGKGASSKPVHLLLVPSLLLVQLVTTPAMITSSKDLIKWSCIIKATVPDAVDHFGGMRFVLTFRSRHDRADGGILDAILKSQRKLGPIHLSEEPLSESALPR